MSEMIKQEDKILEKDPLFGGVHCEVSLFQQVYQVVRDG